VLLLGPGERLDIETVRSTLDARIRGVPRLRQRLQPTRFGCGRPIWVDDASFDVTNHVDETSCPAPGDRDGVLAVAADRIARPIPRDRPLWSLTLLTGLADDAVALVVRFHHVLADGMGGLAVLASLVDGARPAAVPEFPLPAPGPLSLFADAMRARLETLARIGELPHWISATAAELGRRPPRAARSALNPPRGHRRSLAVARTDLDAIHTAASGHGASINDAVLAAVTGALGRFLAKRGEHLDHLVVSIPVSGRGAATTTELGNQIGVMAVRLPATGSAGDRVEAIATITRSHKERHRGASVTALGSAIRLLAAIRFLRWFTDHQRMVNTFVTNLRGPGTPVRFLDRAVVELVPINSTSGNVRVAFGVFSYAGALTVTIVADASLSDELSELVCLLEDELEAIAAPPEPGGASTTSPPQ
jgi:WS/DGAT/MGAT family acyltransferase